MAVRHTLESTLVRFARHLYARRGLCEVTVQNYVSAIRRLAPAIGLEPTPKAIEHEIERMHRSGASYSHIVNTSIALEAYCTFLGRLIELGRPRKPRHLVRGTLSEAEVTLLIAAARSLRERTMIATLAYAGLRERAGQPGDPVFVCLRSGRPYAQQNLRKLIRTAARRAGLNKRVYPYLLRHSLATNLLHRGAHLLAIKEQLGHAFVETTMIYIHSSPEHAQLQYRMYAPSYL